MSLDGYPIDDDYIDPDEGTSSIRPTEDPRDEEEIDLTHSHGECVSAAVTERDGDRTHTFLGGDEAMSMDDRIDAEAIVENDGRSTTNTFFYPEEAPPEKREQYVRLAKLNDGMYDDSRHQRTRKADQRRTALTWCSSLDLNDYQTDRVLWLIERLDLRAFGHYAFEHVLVALISLVANEDGRWIRDERRFRTLVRENDLTMKQVRRLRTMMKRDSKWDGRCRL